MTAAKKIRQEYETAAHTSCNKEAVQQNKQHPDRTNVIVFVYKVAQVVQNEVATKLRAWYKLCDISEVQ